MKRKLNILIACEESQAICREFRKLGQNAYSCDLQECSGRGLIDDMGADPHPEWHFNHDVMDVINKTNLTLQDGTQAHIEGEWDLMIAHPPCTYLAHSGIGWLYHPDDKNLPVEQRRPHPLHPNRKQDQQEAVEFFLKLANANVKRIAVENPVGHMSNIWRKPDQVVNPYDFGDSYAKRTCLWLKNLILLHSSNATDDHGEEVVYKSGRKSKAWYNHVPSNTEGRRKARSKTFPGMARAIAEQWTIYCGIEEGIMTPEEMDVLGDDYVEVRDQYFAGRTRYHAFIEYVEQSLIKYWREALWQNS